MYELQHKARLLKGKKTLESSKALVVRVTMLEVKTDNSSNESLFAEKRPKPKTKIIQPLTERGGAADNHAGS